MYSHLAEIAFFFDLPRARPAFAKSGAAFFSEGLRRQYVSGIRKLQGLLMVSALCLASLGSAMKDETERGKAQAPTRLFLKSIVRNSSTCTFTEKNGFVTRQQN